MIHVFLVNYVYLCMFQGFPYLVSGKYGEDYGLVSESCAPYQGHKNAKCPRQSYSRECAQFEYTTGYRYIGGFYGECEHNGYCSC